MIEYDYSKLGISIRHVWFAESYTDRNSSVDVFFYHYLRDEPIIETGYFSKRICHTLITDLSEDEKALCASIDKGFRYEIRRCSREDEQVRYELYDQNTGFDKQIMQLFKDTYENMYTDKGMRVRFNNKQVDEMIRNNCFLMTVGYREEEPLVFHSYVYDRGLGKVRFHYSASSFRRSANPENVGRVNKGLHWFDICRFKSMGVMSYDWGGISNPEKPNGIDNFKLKFGGTITRGYNIIVGNSLKGKALVSIYNLNKSMKH